MIEQLYFPGFQEAVAASIGRAGKMRLAVGNLSAERFIAVLTLALLSENLSFTTYALMVRISSSPGDGGGVTICDMVEDLNISYHAIFHQVERAPYFVRDLTGKRIRVKLNMEGERKLARMRKRLAGRVRR